MKSLVAGTFAILFSFSAYSADCKKNICVGNVVIDSNNRIGEVIGFPDADTVRYVVNGYSFVANNSSVSKETDTHPKFKKNMSYATARHQVGKISYFFENGKVQLQILSGLTVVETELFSQVEAIGEYQTNVSVVEPQERRATVIGVFENGTISYVLNNPKNETESAPQSGKIAKFFLEINAEKLKMLVREDEVTWLQDVGEMIINRSNDQHFSPTTYRPLLLPAQLPEFKKSLLERLAQEPEIIYEANLRSLVHEYLSKGKTDS